MAVDLPLAEMSLADKLQAMELLWAELSKTPEQQRRDRVRQGTASFQSWHAAMGELRAELRGHQAP
ncbi:addiction module component [Cyanobium sp. La Preciosa 7G6]|uniref:addiction module component n=2 Tax=unclassified Cyanobium TaxID=2627006 RepID=UPI0020CC1ECA|nr:addiction module component [Cyanobium sp. La Preciosa 7G6]MCP9835496.1 addiction module component [Cyanobium sp. La Preciosa 7G6]MCP9938262.1 addiction module component [Cyanobium sp. Aljojuca 7A6]